MNASIKLKSSYTDSTGRRNEVWIDDDGEIYTRNEKGRLTRANSPSGMTLVASTHQGDTTERILKDRDGKLYHQVDDDEPELVSEHVANAVRAGWTTRQPARHS